MVENAVKTKHYRFSDDELIFTHTRLFSNTSQITSKCRTSVATKK